MNVRNQHKDMKRIFIKKYNLISIFAIISIVFVYCFQFLNTGLHKKPEKVIQADVISYYGYLPATFIRQDYTLSFLEDTTEDTTIDNSLFWHLITPNGGRLFKTSMGMSFLYAPFFFIAHAVATPLGDIPNGYSAPYGSALLLGCIIYIFIAFLLLRKLLLYYYSDGVIATTLLIIGLASNLYWYATIEAPMSHGYSFFLFAACLFLTHQWYEKQRWTSTVLLGLVIGLISLVRPTNSLIILLFLFFGICRISDIKIRFQLFLKNYAKLLVLGACIILIWIPQLLYWKSITGDWFYYSYGEKERFFFTHPHIFDALFSFRKGWLIYTPSMILAVVGMYFVWKKNRIFFYPILFFFLINLYVISSWWCWWYGGGFGMRALIESYALLAIPLAAFLSWASQLKLKAKIPVFTCILLLSMLSTFHTIRYYYGSIHWDSMTKEAYFDGFWRIDPSIHFDALIQKPDYAEAVEGREAVIPK
jgi:hypothetical protein